jgi:PAS domain S-box-containing protein
MVTQESAEWLVYPLVKKPLTSKSTDKNTKSVKPENKKVSEVLNFLNLKADSLYLSALMNNIPDTIYFKDTNSNFTRINKAQTAVLGLKDPKEAEGKSDFDFFTPEHSQDALNDEQEIVKTGQPLINKVERIRRADGEFRWVAATKVPIKDDNDQVIGLVGVSRDITVIRQMEENLKKNNEELEKSFRELQELQQQLKTSNELLQQSNADLENYTYVVSHDLKTPLRAIRSFSTFLLEDYYDKLDETGQEYLKRIENATTHMNELIESLLVLSRVGRKFIEIEKVNLNSLLDEIIMDLKPIIESRNGKIIINKLPEIDVQRVWIKELFMNLIDNGLKYNKSPIPKVEISCKERAEDYLFKVTDNGIGIEEKYLPRIFKLFERLHSSEEYEGTGAGLAICKRIVENFGGKIWVESIFGKGSSFLFTKPKNSQ